MRKEARKTRRLPTLSIAMDLVLEGGFSDGFNEIAGEEDAGKTTLCRETVAVNLRQRTTNVLDHDLEGKLHEDRRVEIMRHHHVDLALAEKEDRYLYDRPYNAEEGRYVATNMAVTGKLGLYIVDSIPAMQSREIVEKALKDEKVQNAMHAKTISEFLSPMLQIMRRRGGVVLLVNQIREEVRQTGGRKITYTTGGRAPKYYSVLRLRIRRGERSDEGWPMIVRIYKNHAGKGWTGELNLHCTRRGLFRWHEETFAFGRKYNFITRKVVRKQSVYQVPEVPKIEPMSKLDFIQWIYKTPSFRDFIRDRVLIAEGIEV